MELNTERWEPFSMEERMAISVALTMQVVQLHADGDVPRERIADFLEMASKIVSEIAASIGEEGVDPTLLHKALEKMRSGA